MLGIGCARFSEKQPRQQRLGQALGSALYATLKLANISMIGKLRGQAAANVPMPQSSTWLCRCLFHKGVAWNVHHLGDAELYNRHET
jgi:hypothetical protein